VRERETEEKGGRETWRERERKIKRERKIIK
jgi:hypothetical protein